MTGSIGAIVGIADEAFGALGSYFKDKVEYQVLRETQDSYDVQKNIIRMANEGTRASIVKRIKEAFGASDQEMVRAGSEAMIHMDMIKAIPENIYSRIVSEIAGECSGE